MLKQVQHDGGWDTDSACPSLQGPGERLERTPNRSKATLMKISFASERPAGAYALALPVWSEDMVADRLSRLDPAARSVAARAADAQRFEREAASIAETFVAE